MKNKSLLMALAFIVFVVLMSCGTQNSGPQSGALGGDASSQVYVGPGEKDEFYAFVSGGFSGQMTVHGLPSCRLLKTIPVFSLDGEKGYGFNEETKPLLNTSHGFIPWDDSHHPELSRPMEKPMADGYS